jgi:hypothetical protein
MPGVTVHFSLVPEAQGMAGKKGQKRHPKATARERAWLSMRIMREFSMADIQATAEISRSNLDKYLSLLARYGYVQKVGWVNRGKRGGYEKLLLVRDTGPKSPLVLRDTGMRDLNTGEEYSPEGVGYGKK